ncbi:hypothetical protein OHS70_17485 [Streptomyces sp. NBC_00390]|uniref:hypothetical protein n=1 Tax=Streptomyces sp. NBC_00390 TaxID=2975736 RepID=UPI002E1A43DC
MASLSERKSLRRQILREIYDRSGGTSALIDAKVLQVDLGVSDHEMAAACEYLAGEGLALLEADTFGTAATPSLIALTHKGVVQAEDGAGD